jgi:hypothetical protein
MSTRNRSTRADGRFAHPAGRRVRAADCPTLCLVGEGEVETFHTQTRLSYEALTVPKELRVTTIAEGADGHCQSNNFPLSQRLVFDWLDRTLAA